MTGPLAICNWHASWDAADKRASYLPYRNPTSPQIPAAFLFEVRDAAVAHQSEKLTPDPTMRSLAAWSPQEGWRQNLPPAHSLCRVAFAV